MLVVDLGEENKGFVGVVLGIVSDDENDNPIKYKIFLDKDFKLQFDKEKVENDTVSLNVPVSCGGTQINKKHTQYRRFNIVRCKLEKRKNLPGLEKHKNLPGLENLENNGCCACCDCCNDLCS